MLADRGPVEVVFQSEYRRTETGKDLCRSAMSLQLAIYR